MRITTFVLLFVSLSSAAFAQTSAAHPPQPIPRPIPPPQTHAAAGGGCVKLPDFSLSSRAPCRRTLRPRPLHPDHHARHQGSITSHPPKAISPRNLASSATSFTLAF